MGLVSRATPRAVADDVASGRVRRRSLGSAAWVGYAFVLPNLLGFAVFTLLPLLFAFAVAFTQWDVVSGLRALRWVGLRNFGDLLRDEKFWESARYTLFYAGVSVPCLLVLGLLAAIALNGPIPGRAVLRLVFFVPFIVNQVAIAATWILLYHPRYGPINTALRAVGIADPPQWLASSQWALRSLVVMAVWAGVGYAALIYLAALQDIPQELYEASALDGAGGWTQFRIVTLPFLSPTIFFLAVTGFIGASQNFGMVNLMTRGGPGRATTVLSYYIYQNGFQFYKFGYAAALSWIMFAGVLLLTLALWRVQRRSVFYG